VQGKGKLTYPNEMFSEGDFVNGVLKNGKKYEIMFNGDEY
jgi:hypothetical protein